MIDDKTFRAQQQFVDSNRIGVWPFFGKRDVINQIEANLMAPRRLGSTHIPFCGQAALISELIHRQPEQYVVLCRSLFERGAFQARNLIIEPLSQLLNSQVRFDLPAVDWMWFATLHQAERDLFDGHDGIEIRRRVSTPKAVRNWARYLLSFDLIESIDTTLYGQIDALHKAGMVLNHGGCAFLLIDISILKEAPNFTYSGYVWVSLLSISNTPKKRFDDLTQNEKISFRCFFNGEIYDVMSNTKIFEGKMAYAVLAY